MAERKSKGRTEVVSANAAFEDSKVNTRVMLSGLWASLTLCFLYADYFGLYKPGWLEGMLAGNMGPLGEVTQGVLLGVSVLMAIPCLMVFLSLVLKPGLNRWVNIVVAVLFAVMMLLTMIGEWLYYIFFATIEIVLTGFVVWYAWNWPREEARQKESASTVSQSRL